MEYFAGIDVSLEQSSVCVVDGAGKIVREAKVASEPEALVGFFRGLETGVTRIGLEAGPLLAADRLALGKCAVFARFDPPDGRDGRPLLRPVTPLPPRR